MKKNILDRKFIHHAWFTNSNLTRRQAIEYFASCVGDFSLMKKNKATDSLLEDNGYDYILHGYEDNRNWKMTEEEATYYNQRVQFYQEFWKDHSFEDRKLIPEYADYIVAINR